MVENHPTKINYVFACTCKNTNPKPNPKSVITKQTTAVVTISPIFFLFLKIFDIDFSAFSFFKQAISEKWSQIFLEKPVAS